MLSLKLSKAGHSAGEYSAKQTDPNRIEFARVGELRFVGEDDADEVSTPAPPIPTDGANEEGGSSTIPMVRTRGFVREREALVDYSAWA